MKKITLILSTMLILLILFTCSASAVEISQFTSDSTFTPVNYDTHKSTSTVTLYGNADYICMKVYSETANNENFCLEVYSDSKYKNYIAGYRNNFKKGTKYENILFDLTELGSGTYYAKSYVEKRNIIGYLQQDPDTVKKFKIVIKKGGTSSIKNMKAIMYGYENTENGPAIYWYSIPDAEGYYVYRYDDGEYKKIKTVKASGTDISCYIDKSYKNKNGTKKYKIKAYNDGGTTSFSKNNIKAYILKTPTVKVTATSSNRLKISWSSVKKSATYYLYRRTSSTDWQRVTSTESTSHYDGDIKNNTVYYYTVIASTSNSISGYDTSGKSIRFLKAPTSNKPTAAEVGLSLSWSTISGADSYVIYRKSNPSDDWEKIGTSSTTEYNDITAEKNTVYIYTVRSARGSTLGSYNSIGVCGGNFDTPILNEVVRDSNGNAIVSWSPVNNCSSYLVYRKAPDGSEWTNIGSTKNTQFIDEDSALISGTNYIYTVKGKSQLNTKFTSRYTVYTPYDKTGKSFVYYKQLNSVNVVPVENGLTVKWDTVLGADKYFVYRKTSDSDYTLLGETEQSSFNDTTAEKNVQYSYKVTYICGELELAEYGQEIPVIVVDNSISIDVNEMHYSESTYCKFKLNQYSKDDTYYIYTKNGEDWVYSKSFKTTNGWFTLDNTDESQLTEYIITSVSEDGIVSGFENAQCFTAEFLPATQLTKSVNQLNETVTLTWNAVEGAEKYNILRDNNVIATLTDATTYADKEADSGIKAYYKVQAVKNNFYSESNTVDAYIIEVPKVTVKNASSGIKVSWSSYGDKYRLYRKKAGDTDWTRIKTLSSPNNSYIDESVETGEIYYYTVRVKSNLYDGYSNYDRTGAKITYLPPVQISSLKIGDGKVTVKWNKLSAAKSYIVYRKVSGVGGSWQKLQTVESSAKRTFVDDTVKSGKKYYYSIVAVNDSYRSYRTYKYVWYLDSPELVSAKATSSGITVKFKSVEGATKYLVYRKTSSSSFKSIGTVKSSKTSYVDETTKKGVKYTYTVKAIRGDYSSVYNSKGVSAKR